MGIELLFFLGLGCIIGVIAGLLGVGGGTVVVPTLVFFLTATGVEPDLIMKIALGTSFATVSLTSISSVIAHQRKGSVMWKIAFKMAIGAAIGVAIGSRIVSIMPDMILQVLFSLFLAYTIFNMLNTASRKEPEAVKKTHQSIYWGSGGLIGFLSSFVGIGGGVMIVPVLNHIGYKMRYAIATSSAVGAFLAFSGAASSVINGLGVENLPANSWGFVYLPGFIGLSITSVLFAPLGAKLVYILPVKRIRQIFALFLTIVLVIFLYNNVIA